MATIAMQQNTLLWEGRTGGDFDIANNIHNEIK